MAWLAGWAERVKVTINHNDIDAALSNFPVLIYLSTSSGYSGQDVSYVFDELQNDGNRKKIAVTKRDGVTECYVEIEKWVDAEEKAWLWVKVPDVDPDVDTELYLYYDSSHADNDTYVGDPSDAVVHNVWDSNFKLVTHMRDDPDNQHIRDSTVNINDGTKNGANEPIVTTAGMIDDAQDFDGEDDYVEVPGSVSLNPRTAITISAWIYPIDNIGRNIVIYGERGTNIPYRIELDYERLTWFWYNGQTNYNKKGSVIPTDTWSSITVTFNGDKMIFYLNSDLTHEYDVTMELLESAGPLRIGAYWWTAGAKWFYGLIDDVRISNIARSPAWIKATYESGRDHLLYFGEKPAPPANPLIAKPLVTPIIVGRPKIR